MNAHGAAPGPVDGRPGSGLSTTGGARSIPPDLVPARVIERLAAEDITSLEQWRALGRKRRAIFGITAAMVRQLDELARESR